MLTRAQKAEVVKSLKDKFLTCEGVFVVTFKGFRVSESNEIRKLMREKGGEFKVVKNTLIKLASQDTPAQPLNDFIQGPTALIIAYKDPIEIAKEIDKFIENHPSLQLNGFVIQGKAFKGDDIKDLVKLPPKEVLLSQFLGTLQAPLVNFVGVLSAIIRKLLYVLKAIEEKKSKSE